MFNSVKNTSYIYCIVENSCSKIPIGYRREQVLFKVSRRLDMVISHFDRDQMVNTTSVHVQFVISNEVGYPLDTGELRDKCKVEQKAPGVSLEPPWSHSHRFFRPVKVSTGVILSPCQLRKRYEFQMRLVKMYFPVKGT